MSTINSISQLKHSTVRDQKYISISDGFSKITRAMTALILAGATVESVYVAGDVPVITLRSDKYSQRFSGIVAIEGDTERKRCKKHAMIEGCHVEWLVELH